MNKNIKNKLKAIITLQFISSSLIQATGSILLYNNSLYKVRLVIITKNSSGANQTSNVDFDPAPINGDGSLKTQTDTKYYAPNLNVPIGTVKLVQFADTLVDFKIQILD